MSNYFCTNSGRDCNFCQQDCQQQSHECCQQQSHECCQQSECPCGEEFRHALDFLCDSALRSLIDFDAFAFLTDFFLLGTSLQATICGTAPDDNLNDLNGSLVCGGDSCETIQVSGPLHYPIPNTAALNASISQVVLCQLNAIAFDAASTGDGQESNFQTIRHTLSRLLKPRHDQDCCCSSIAEALTSAAAVRTTTLTAGPLLVKNAAILGQIGDILVLANSADYRFYLVCANKIAFLG